MRFLRSSLEAAGHAFRSLGIRNYRLFWSGQLVSLAGVWMQDIALSWLVLSLTDSPAALGLTMAIRFLPALVFSLYGGVIADAWPKRRTILIAQHIQLSVALTLAILTSTGLITVALIYLLAGIRGLVESVEGPARQAFVPEMVGTGHLPNAVALNSMLFNGARLVGPAIGAAVISTLGIAACFFINAACFPVAIGAVAAIRTSELHLVSRAPRSSSWSQLREGFRYVRSTPQVVVIFIVMGMIGAFGYNFQTLLPLVAKYLLGAGASTLAWLTTTMAAGSVVAGLFVAYRSRPTLQLLLGSAGAFVVLLAAVAFSRWTVLTLALLFISGFLGVLFMTTANTRLQLGVPDHLRGRVMGIYVLLFIGTTPIGSYLIGFLAEHLSSDFATSVRGTVLCLAALCGAGVLAGLVYHRRHGAASPGGSGSFAETADGAQ